MQIAMSKNNIACYKQESRQLKICEKWYVSLSMKDCDNYNLTCHVTLYRQFRKNDLIHYKHTTIFHLFNTHNTHRHSPLVCQLFDCADCWKTGTMIPE